MVKIPNLNDLKKMGSNLVDSVNVNDMVDRMKHNIESAGQNLNKKTDHVPDGEDPIRHQFKSLYASLAKLKQMEAQQQELTRKVEAQLAALAKIFAAVTAENSPKKDKE